MRNRNSPAIPPAITYHCVKTGAAVDAVDVVDVVDAVDAVDAVDVVDGDTKNKGDSSCLLHSFNACYYLKYHTRAY